MNMQQKQRATSPWGDLCLAAIQAGAVAAHALNMLTIEIPYLIVFLLGTTMTSVSAFWKICNPIYLTVEGVQVIRLGKILRMIPWAQISQICWARDYRIAAKGSQIPHILIIPNGCEKYDPSKWSGIRYRFVFRKYVVRIDTTKANESYIRQYYGEIEDRRY